MKSANQLRKLKKRKHQINITIFAIEELLENIKSNFSNPKTVDMELSKLSVFINKYASDKDNSNFKSLTAWSKYAEFIKKDRVEKVERQVKKSGRKNFSWRDFEELILVLKKDGFSNEKIALELTKIGAKCNRETVRLFLKKYNEEQK